MSTAKRILDIQDFLKALIQYKSDGMQNVTGFMYKGGNFIGVEIDLSELKLEELIKPKIQSVFAEPEYKGDNNAEQKEEQPAPILQQKNTRDTFIIQMKQPTEKPARNFFGFSYFPFYYLMGNTTFSIEGLNKSGKVGFKVPLAFGSAYPSSLTTPIQYLQTGFEVKFYSDSLSQEKSPLFFTSIGMQTGYAYLNSELWYKQSYGDYEYYYDMRNLENPDWRWYFINIMGKIGWTIPVSNTLVFSPEIGIGVGLLFTENKHGMGYFPLHFNLTTAYRFK